MELVFAAQKTAQLGNEDQTLLIRFLELSMENFLLFAEKHHDYGAANIAEFGEAGVLIRFNDKFQRIKNLRGKPSLNESKEDTWRDLHNYANIAMLCRRGLWPGAKESDNI
jgi:hypothetical protein